MKYRINNLYPFQVWFLTSITAPIIIGVSLVEWDQFTMEEVTDTISFIGAGILFGGGLSVPTLAFHYLCFFLLVGRNLKESTIKSLLTLVALIGFIITFQVIGLDILKFTMRDIVLPMSYFVSIIGYSSLFPIYKPLKKKRHLVDQQINPEEKKPV
jgi:hypothetical protein